MGVVVAFYAVQLSPVQTNLAHRATVWLSKQMGMSVNVKEVEIQWMDKVSLKNVLIKDTHGRDMIAIDELFVDCATNFAFGLTPPQWKHDFPYITPPNPYFKFDNNLDYVLLKKPNVHLIREPDGDLNFDKFVNKIDSLVSGKPKPPNTPENNTPFTIDNALVEDGTLTMTEPTEKRFPKEEFDQFNFTLHKVSGNLKKFMVLGDTISFNMKNLRAIDYRSNLEIKQLDTKFLYSQQYLIFDKLLARINNSVIRNYISMNFRTPHDMSDFNKKVHLKANFDDCEIDAQDLARFAPSLYKYKEMYRLKGEFSGTVNDFEVQDFGLKFGKNSFFDGKIAFKNLPDLRKAVMDFDLKPSQIDAPDTRQYVGDSLYKDQIEKFGKVGFSGTFKGLYDNFRTNALVESSNLGKVIGNISMKIAKNPAETSYSGDISTDNLDLGKIIKNPELLQKISMAGKMEGKGLTINSVLMNFNGFVKHVGFDGYDYKELFLDGKMGHSLFDGRVVVKDTNIKFDLSGTIDFSKALNHFKLQGNVIQANLKALGYSENDVKLKSVINVDFQGNQMDNLLGDVKLYNTILSYDKRRLGVDSLLLNATLSADSMRKISINSEFFNSEISGRFLPSNVIRDVKRLVNEYNLYFNGKESDRIKYYIPRQNFIVKDKYEVNYKILFKKSDELFAYFYPQVYISPGTALDGSLNIRNTSELSLSGNIDTLRYNKYEFFKCDVDINTSKEALSPKVLTSFIFNSEKQQLNRIAPTEKFSLSGAWDESNVIEFDSKIRQQNSTNKAQLFGKLTFKKEGFDLAFRNTKLDLLGSSWMLAKDNLINFTNNDICFQNIQLSDDMNPNHKQSIALNGTFSPDSTKESRFEVHEFDLQTLKPLTNLDLKGIVNGHLNLQDIYRKTLITSQLQVENLAYKNILIGSVAGEALWDALEQHLNINSNVTRLGNEIFRLSGHYNPNSTNNPLNLKAELKQTNLEILGTFVDNIFSNLGGFVSGTLSIKGKPSDPIVRGPIYFEKGVLRINALNTFLYFNDKMEFNEEGFLVKDNFKVRDAEKNGNVATLEGGIYNGGGGNFMLNLQAYMNGRDGFKILNTTLKDNEKFFGVGITSGSVSLSGPFENLNIAANLTSKKGTKITIMMDDAESADDEDKAITFLQPAVLNSSKTQQDKLKNIDLSGIKMAFNFTITPDAECEVVFDRNLHDQLNAFGDGRIAIEYNTRGGFTMSGPYIVKHGIYNYSFQGISALRKFNIQEGSSLRWTGDPTDADIDLQATYTANVQLTGIPGIVSTTSTTSATNSQLSNRYPVNISIILKEKMLKPAISFDIKFDPKQTPLQYQVTIQGFEQRLKEDEQLMNKNLATLILANRFFPEDNVLDAFNAQMLVDNLGGILTNQVGSLANKLDQNLDVGVQLGTIKQNIFDNLRVNVGYKLMNNRLRLGVNGTNQTNDQYNSQLYYGGEVEWALTEDGTWRMKAYSRTIPSSYLLLNSTSNVVMNGISLQYTRNFNSFFKRTNHSRYLLQNSSTKSLLDNSVTKSEN